MTTPAQRKALHDALDAALNLQASVSMMMHPRYHGDQNRIHNLLADALPGKITGEGKPHEGVTYKTDGYPGPVEVVVFKDLNYDRPAAPAKHDPQFVTHVTTAALGERVSSGTS